MEFEEYIMLMSKDLPNIQSESRMIYHYTNASAIQSILKDHTFRASDATFLIDAREVNLINYLLKKIDFNKFKYVTAGI